MSGRKYKIGVLGAGGWGTSLALVLSYNKHDVVLWTHKEEHYRSMLETRYNSDFLPNIKIDDNIKIEYNIDELNSCDYLVNAIPTQYITDTIQQFNFDLKNKKLINGSKGVEISSLSRISQIFEKFGVFPNNYAVITGPSHAEEVSRRTPTAVVSASQNNELNKEVQNVFSNEYFRVYSSNDVVGCELGGAIKNVIAIAAGIIDGLKLGDNTKAALLTRGIAEISRLGEAMGAVHKTFSGLSGLGDLFVTCNSEHSRNRKVGELIGKGHSLDEIRANMKMIAEGVYTTQATVRLSKEYNVEMPITHQVYEILFENVQPIKAINELMTRQSKSEWWW